MVNQVNHTYRGRDSIGNRLCMDSYHPSNDLAHKRNTHLCDKYHSNLHDRYNCNTNCGTLNEGIELQANHIQACEGTEHNTHDPPLSNKHKIDLHPSRRMDLIRTHDTNEVYELDHSRNTMFQSNAQCFALRHYHRRSLTLLGYAGISLDYSSY